MAPIAHDVSDMRGRVALVTGGSGGIGAALVDRLEQEGVTTAVHYARHRPTREHVFQADLEDPAAPDRLVDAVEAELGPIDILAANAGHSHRATYEEVDAEAFDRMLAINLRAPFLLARRVLPGMRERGYGRILFTSSVAALIGGVVGPHYAASKAGLHGLTHFLASRVAGDGVTVNAIAPALIEDTGMLPGDPGELAKLIPAGRLGRPDEVADLMLAILRNGYMTNQVVGLDGGMHPR
jgi:3-oxoacyl-[acyl-carrier protein] reductase